MVSCRQLNKNSRVIEIASNDGYLLQFYKRAGIEVLGIEPASNVAATAVERGIPTLCAFFSRELAQRLSEQDEQADVIHAHNVLAHVADLDGFLCGLALVLKNDGQIVIEVPYVKDMIEHVEFDTVYHEHLCYFSLTSLNLICERHGLVITSVERLAIHGGSLRIFVEHATDGLHICASVSQMLSDEARCGLEGFSFYKNLPTRVSRLRKCLLEQLRALKSEGLRIAAYGASAKGATLLNHFGIGSDILDFVVDRNGFILPAHICQFTPSINCLLRCRTTFCYLPGTSSRRFSNSSPNTVAGAGASSSLFRSYVWFEGVGHRLSRDCEEKKSGFCS
jgi:SAM-dependent methyltransferase